MPNSKYGRECMKRIIFFCLLIAFASALNTASASSTKEDLMRLQSDVLQLQKQVLEMGKNLNENIDGLKSLVAQLKDETAAATLALNKVSSAIESQASGVRNNDQALLQEIRALSTKTDENTTRIAALAQQMQELKIQSKALSQEPQGGQASGFSAEALYSQASQDLATGNFDLAINEFTGYLDNFPTGKMAAAAQLNIGEAYFSQKKLPQAIAAFTRVMENYSNSDKVAPALYKRGLAKLSLQQTEDAIADFNGVLKLFPTSAESDLAKIQLQSLGSGTAKTKQPTRKTR
jgi:tol-pal system protein YbgF